MRFHHEEMLCFHSISSGPEPFRIAIGLDEGEKTEEIVERTKSRLREKKILDAGNHLTLEGTAILRAYELYRNSETHLILNHLKVALLPNGVCVVLEPKEDGYEMFCTDHVQLMELLLTKALFLKNMETGTLKEKWKALSYRDWAAYLEEEKKGRLLVVGEYQNQETIRECVFGWTEDSGFVYDLNRKQIKALSGGEMEQAFRKFLGLPGEWEPEEWEPEVTGEEQKQERIFNWLFRDF